LLKSKGKLLDIVNLAEESLLDLLDDIKDRRVNARIQGLVISSDKSYEIYVDFMNGTPVLALMKNDVKLEGNDAWRELNKIASKAVGFLEVYELTEKEINEDIATLPTAKISAAPEKKLPVKCHSKIDTYSIKLASMIPIKTLFIVNSIRLNAKTGLEADKTNIPLMITREINGSEDIVKYILATIEGSELWRSFEILAMNGQVLAAVIYKADGSPITGLEALRAMLSSDLLGKYSSFDLMIYESELNPIDVFENMKMKVPVLLLERPDERKQRKKKEAKILAEEAERKEKKKIKADVNIIRAKANEYFLEVLDIMGYELEDLKIEVNDIVRFKVKIKKKGFSFRRPGIRLVKRKLIDEVRWILAELRMRMPFEVEVAIKK